MRKHPNERRKKEEILRFGNLKEGKKAERTQLCSVVEREREGGKGGGREREERSPRESILLLNKEDPDILKVGTRKKEKEKPEKREERRERREKNPE